MMMGVSVQYMWIKFFPFCAFLPLLGLKQIVPYPPHSFYWNVCNYFWASC